MLFTRGEWITLSLFVLALMLNVAVVIRQNGTKVCEEELEYGGRPQTRCEEDPPTEDRYLEPPQK